MTTNNHPAHDPVSLDRLHQISEILSKAATQSDGGNLGYAMADAVKVIDGAIAAFCAEPVAWLHSDNGIGIPAITRSRNVADSWFSKGWNIKPLYTTPPASVVPDAISTRQAIAKMENHEPCDSINVAYKYGWNACRAAMLQAFGNSEQLKPLSHGVKLPLDYLQGHKDGLEWAAQLAEANHPQTGDWLYDDPIDLARAIRKGPDMPNVQTGNSPVTPDTWIPVSERMPETDGNYWGWWSESKRQGPVWFIKSDLQAQFQSSEITHWMPLPAAPQQEVKS